MRPKKRDQQVLEEPKSQLDQAQADHELFLQAFESKNVYFVSYVTLICFQNEGFSKMASLLERMLLTFYVFGYI